MSQNNEDVSVPVDSPTGNGVTTGLPPTGDDKNMIQVLKRLNDLEAEREETKKWKKDLEKKNANLEAEREETKKWKKDLEKKNANLEVEREENKKWKKDFKANHDEEIKRMKKAIGPKALYVEMGGDVGLYSNLKILLPRLRRHYANDADGLQQLERWAKKCDKEGNMKGGLLLVGGAGIGAAFSISIIVSNYCGIAAGSAAVAGIAAGPVVWILLGGIGVGVLIAAGLWAGYKLYQYKKLSKD